MTGQNLVLKVKTSAGNHVLKGLTSVSTVDDLYTKVADITSLSRTSFKIMTGFPPKPIEVMDMTSTLNTIGVKSGETLTVKAVSAPPSSAQSPPEPQSQSPNTMHADNQPTTNTLSRFVVPANNSCLFTSVHLLMYGGELNLDCADSMRQLVAAAVRDDPVTYNEVLLGKSNKEYCDWILDSTSWGGAIEVSILSQHFEVEIDVVDTQTVRMDRFGEDQSYTNRIFLIYDGIHYDPLKKQNQVVFPRSDHVVVAQALDLASEANEKHQFTDVQNFTLQCLICQKGLTGQGEAQDHAKKTGHINFGEAKKSK